MGEVGGLETSYIKGMRLYERQEKPTLVEVEADLLELDPHAGTKLGVYQRDKKRLKQQMSYMRVYYMEEYKEAVRRKEARMKREYEIVRQLKTERLIQKRIRAYYNIQAAAKRAAEMAKKMAKKKAQRTRRWRRFNDMQAKERLYQIAFLREEREQHWIQNVDDLTESLFYDEHVFVPQGSLPLGGSGVQSNFVTKVSNVQW